VADKSSKFKVRGHTLIDKDKQVSTFPQIRLITFGAGAQGIQGALSRLERQSKKLSPIDSVKIYREEDLGPDYDLLFGDLRMNFPKGYGLWSWKPYLIKRELSLLREGDILIYLDAGVEINPRGAKRFVEYLDIVAQRQCLLFSQATPHRLWTKPVQALLPSDRHFFRNQIVAGILMFQVGDLSKKLVADWLELCSLDNGTLLVDSADVGGSSEVKQGSKDFKAHRHDQSILSRVVFEQGHPVVGDETYFEPWSRGKNYPFLALRNKQTGVSWLWPALYLWGPLFKAWQYVTLALTPGVARSKLSSHPVIKSNH
jgi:hypothetical protein